LTGRASNCTFLLDCLSASPQRWFGGGFGGGLAAVFSEISPDNGYVHKLLDFGYIGGMLFFMILIWIANETRKMAIQAKRARNGFLAFPFAIMLTLFAINATEGMFLTKSIYDLMFALVVFVVVKWKYETLLEKQRLRVIRAPMQAMLRPAIE